VVCTESNARWDGDNVQEILTKDGKFRGDVRGEHLIGEVEFMSDNNKRAGIVKTAKRTVQYILDTSNHMITQQVAMHKKVGTSNTRKPIQHILGELKDELARFRWPDSDPDNPRYHQGNKLTGTYNTRHSFTYFEPPMLTTLLSVLCR
jgi:hypothetical protein